ncbi:XRN 5'-3' exonuclease N-terminus-domain-containing protein [Entophlyctis helioformis]|nr:XRN 5'-3' exonuclease N-terminus-domain-containing protein [Entophlyctis helioformis]
MGIPALFRWLSTKYPKTTSQCVEEVPVEINGTVVPVDTTQPNPNGEEFDNLYLDMNGIIHPCCHPEDRPAPATEDEMYVEIFRYMERIMSIVRPRKVLYMAIDGVAPRAKMNQQRSRRFRAAQEEEIKRADEERIRKEWEAAGDRPPLPAEDKKQHFDSNCITPGTPFMDRLAICLRYYVVRQLNSDPGWRNIKVVLSDASVPGEGEHKIMDYIRRSRNQPGYDANTSHVLYGLDADLIMLALATHEPHFKILREDVFFKDGKQDGCFLCGQSGHRAAECRSMTKAEPPSSTAVKPYIFLHVSILREYLEAELSVSELPFAWNIERALDDWVFLCFFVGNDFLPHLPSLEIREGAIDQLINIWKRKLPAWGGYLTDAGDIDLKRVEDVMGELGKVEDVTFQKRRDEEERKREGRLRRKKQQREATQRRDDAREGDGPPAIVSRMADVVSYPVRGVSREERAQTNRQAVAAFKAPGTLDANKAAAQMLRARLSAGTAKKDAVSAPDTPSADTPSADAVSPAKSAGHKRPATDDEDNVAGGAGGTDAADTDAAAGADEVVQEPPTKRIAIEATAEAGDAADGDKDQAMADTTEAAEPAAIQDLFEEEEEEEEEEVIEESMTVAEVPIPKVHHLAKPKKPDVDSDEEAPEDDVRLWETGWKERYYRNKFNVDLGDRKFRAEVVTAYVEGLCWVLKYYYQGVQSWKWFYPYHYAPFASDFDFVGSLEIKFELGTPFRPVEQLMGVFPAASRPHIPPVLHPLMINDDSEIIDFYPATFPIDLNGKKYAWQGVALLPFIEEERLLKAIEPLYERFTAEERRRNRFGDEIVIVGGSHAFAGDLEALYGHGVEPTDLVPIDPVKSGGMFGFVRADPAVSLPGSTYESPLLARGLEDIAGNTAITAVYVMPVVPVGSKYRAHLLGGAKMPPRVLSRDDVYAVKMGYHARGSRGGGRGGRGGRGGGFHTFDQMVVQRMTGMGPGGRRDDYGGGRGAAVAVTVTAAAVEEILVGVASDTTIIGATTAMAVETGKAVTETAAMTVTTATTGTIAMVDRLAVDPTARTTREAVGMAAVAGWWWIWRQQGHVIWRRGGGGYNTYSGSGYGGGYTPSATYGYQQQQQQPQGPQQGYAAQPPVYGAANYAYGGAAQAYPQAAYGQPAPLLPGMPQPPMYGQPTAYGAPFPPALPGVPALPLPAGDGASVVANLLSQLPGGQQILNNLGAPPQYPGQWTGYSAPAGQQQQQQQPPQRPPGGNLGWSRNVSSGRGGSQPRGGRGNGRH